MSNKKKSNILLTPDEQPLYDSFVDKWVETFQVAGGDDISRIFNDRALAYDYVYNDVRAASPNDETAVRISTALVDTLPGFFNTASKSKGAGGVLKTAAGETKEIDGKNYKKVTGMGLSGSIGVGFEVIKRDGDMWVPADRYDELKELMASIKLDLKKSAGDWNPPKNEDYHPGSNTSGPVPYQMPKHPGDLSRRDQQDASDYTTLSLLEREPEEHAGQMDGPSGGGAQDHGGERGRIDNIYPEPSNWLRPFKGLPIPPGRYNQDFNSGFDTEYTQRQYGLNLKRIALAKKVYDSASIQLSTVPQELISQIKKLQDQIDPEICNVEMDEDGWIEGGLQKNFHITVLFGVGNNVAGQVKEIFDSTDKPISVKTDKVDYFDNDEGTVAVVKCNSKSLDSLHNELKKSIENTHRKGSYEAHVTIAYLKNGERLPDETLNPVEWDVNNLEISKTGGNVEKISGSRGLNLTKCADEFQADFTGENPPGMEHVCAWCKSLYDELGQPIRQLTPEEYEMIQSHGICENCRQEQKEILRRSREGALNLNKIVKASQEISQNSAHKQALIDWTQLNNDIDKETRIARKILRNVRTVISLKEAGKHILEDASTYRLFQLLAKKYPPVQAAVPKVASILDAPRGVLDQKIWQDGPSGIPMLRPDVKLEIVERFFSYIHLFGGYQSPEMWVKNMFYTGSTATHNYADKSDIDIHVVVDWADMVKCNPDKKRGNPEEMWRDLHDTFWWTLNKLKLAGTKHPMQYYVVRIGEEQKVVDQKEEIYDIGHDVWLIPPGKNSEIPEEVIDAAVSSASEVMSRIDQQISDARKGLVDYALLLEIVNPENAKNVYGELAERVHVIDTNLKEMKKEYSKLKAARSEAFTDQAVNSNFSLDNVIFKLVERYKYLDTLRKIQRLTDSMDLTPDQVPEVANTLGLSELFE